VRLASRASKRPDADIATLFQLMRNPSASGSLDVMHDKDFADFHAFATQGSSIARAAFERADFERAVASLNKRFGLQIVAPNGLYEEILSGLRRTAGRFQQEKYPVEKAAVASRLNKLRASAQHAALALRAMDEGLQDAHDMAALQLVEEAMKRRDPTLSALELESQIVVIRQAVGTLYFSSKDAQAILQGMKSKKGQRGLTWYQSFCEVFLKAAAALQIPLTTAGDRSRNPHATPLTVLAYELERSLPKEARARTLAACAKRVQDALKAARSARGNSSKVK
jgi:hypothetical protein